MSANKDYAQLSLEELLAEEKKIKKQDTISSILMGFAVGIMIYGVANKGFGFLQIFLPAILIYGVYRNAQKLKETLVQIRAEISARNAS